MSRRQFASYRELQGYAKRMGKVCLLQGVDKRQHLFSAHHYEIVDVRTANGVRTAMLISKAVLRTLAAADATFREVTEAKRAGKRRPE
jgi:hypothetical protein